MWSFSIPATNPRSSRNEHSDWGVLEREAFLKMLCVERKRTERSGRRFVLMLLTSHALLTPTAGDPALGRVLAALSRSIRETDIRGWYEESVLGVIFTEVGDCDGKQVAHALLTKVTRALSEVLTVDEIGDVEISFHSFPERLDQQGSDGHADHWLYPDSTAPIAQKSALRVVKRAVDVAGSVVALAAGLPVFAIVALLIKLTSPGPVLFRQRRLGLGGRAFTFLKFRSMEATPDHRIHEEFMKVFIAGGQAFRQHPRANVTAFKITDDPRVTPIGKILRRTSLDELPQFLNVLMGHMSLVGPRPPIPYEVQCYEIWHRRRLLAVKPGITGLWQVAGRSRVSFDEMVRLDLSYAASWSPWLDTKILLQTPRAVLSGAGAY